MATLRITTLVKRGHRLVGRSCLNLHEICPIMTALIAWYLGRVNVFPRSRTAQDIVNLFKFTISSICHFVVYIIYEWTRVACESITIWALFDYQHITTIWTKVEHFFYYYILFLGNLLILCEFNIQDFGFEI
jgi:hypothetical protein